MTLNRLRLATLGWRRLNWGFALIALASLPALWPLFRPGFFVSDDGMIHLYRLAALDSAVHAGVIYPRWFPDFAFGYGYPVLNFYSPLSYYVGLAFHLIGAGYITATEMAFGAGLLLSALAMYLFASESLGRAAAVLASLAYLYAPYHLGDVHRRGALAESLAFVFFPLLLWLSYRLLTRRRALYLFLLALAFAGLILTHNLSAMLFAPLLLAWGGFLFLTKRNPSPGFKSSATWFGLFLAALVIGLGLAAFYTLPVAAEGQYAHLSFDVNSTGYQRHLAPIDGFISQSLVYQYYPDQGTPADWPISPVYLVLTLASVVALGYQARRRGCWQFIIFWLGVAALSIWMMLQASLPLWLVAQQFLSMVQYPWRFMALVDLSMALLIGSLLASGQGWRAQETPAWDRKRLLLALLLALPLAAAPLPNLARPVLPLQDDEITVQRMWQEDYDHEQIGATWTAEYLPLTVKEERWAIPRPVEGPRESSNLSEPPAVELREQSLLSHELRVSTETGLAFRLHAFFFPGWQAFVDGIAAKTYPSGPLGLVTVDIPPGQHDVVVAFQDTPIRQIGMVVSLLFVIGWASGLVVVERRAAIFAGVVLLAIVGMMTWHIRPFNFRVQPAGRAVSLEDKVQLLGHSIEPTSVRPGEDLRISLYWFALTSPSANYKRFIHLVDGAGQVRAQRDGDPVNGFSPTTRWEAGELVIDRYDLPLARDLEPGRYTLLAGMYEYETMRNLLPTNDLEAQRLGNRVVLGEATVVAR